VSIALVELDFVLYAISVTTVLDNDEADVKATVPDKSTNVWRTSSQNDESHTM
jgi:hypothetical protein